MFIKKNLDSKKKSKKKTKTKQQQTKMNKRKTEFKLSLFEDLPPPVYPPNLMASLLLYLILPLQVTKY